MISPEKKDRMVAGATSIMVSSGLMYHSDDHLVLVLSLSSGLFSLVISLVHISSP